jgi:hypothetical protein
VEFERTTRVCLCAKAVSFWLLKKQNFNKKEIRLFATLELGERGHSTLIVFLMRQKYR